MREIILNICIIAIATALFKMLVPDNSFKKQIGFLISCFFITAVISFITGANPGFAEIKGDFNVAFGSETAKIADYSGMTLNAQKRAIGEEVSARVRDILQQNNIYPTEIYVIVNISDSLSISINEIKLVLPPDSDLILTSALVEKEAGDGIKVTIKVE